jgi:D-glycero-alpha-D-manno-heptose-7-phosphate kinase
MPRRESVTASAPSRIDLAGGTLDIWPLSVLVPGASTVNLAIELRATATVEARADGRLRIVSRDRGRHLLRRPLDDPGRARGPLALPLRLAAAFAPGLPLTLTCAATAPAGAGLGGSSTLAVAVGAALARWTGVPIRGERLVRRVMNHEAALLRVPTGNQDYLAALHGGLAVFHHEADGTRREALPVPAELLRRLVLAYTGQPRHSGFSNWEMFRRFVDGQRATVSHMESIAPVARELADALRQGDLDAAGRLLGEEGRLRYRLAPSVATPALLAADRAARAAGALGVKVCGAGGGGCLVAFARRGCEDRVAAAIGATGARLLPLAIARRGLRVAPERPASGTDPKS